MKYAALFLVEFAAFFIATLNFRYCAKGHIRATFITDVLLAANGFVVIKLVSEATTLLEMGSYVLGAGVERMIGGNWLAWLARCATASWPHTTKPSRLDRTRQTFKFLTAHALAPWTPSTPRPRLLAYNW